MRLRRRYDPAGRWLAALCLLAALGCESALVDSGEPRGQVSARRARAVAATRLARDETPAPAPPEEIPSRPVGTQPAPAIEDIDVQILIADPAEMPAALERKLSWDCTRIDEKVEERRKELHDALRARQESGELTPQEREAKQKTIDEEIEASRKKQKADKRQEHEERLPKILTWFKAISRPRTVRLTFTEAIRQALQNSYTVQMQSYSPAIEAARIVEAEAQFDAVYFTNFTNNKQDRPSASQLQGTMYQIRNFESGVRKLLSTGTQAQVSYALDRTQTDLAFQTLNPSYFNNFSVEFRQPFLRGFGLDFNRSQIELRKLDRHISIERLRRDVREVVFNVEQAYWRLVQARRAVSIASQLLTDLEIIKVPLERRAREKYDVLPAQASLVISRIEQHQADFIELCNNVRNAEDTLKRLMNVPEAELNLSTDIEIVPADVPSTEPLQLDQVGEVTAALQHRSELREAKLAIEQAKIGIGIAKNQALPKLDVLFRYIVDGLGPNPDRAFSQLSENDFHEYFIMVEFEWPIGNRGPEAALRQARFQQAQAIAGYRDVIENVIMEVLQAFRSIYSSYDQIQPLFNSATAAARWVEVVKARQERLNLLYFEQELNAHESLAAVREKLLQTLVNYNIALPNLERQKGTLLQSNNIVIQGVDDESYLEPYRPLGP